MSIRLKFDSYASFVCIWKVDPQGIPWILTTPNVDKDGEMTTGRKLVGGKERKGESPVETVCRETSEETGGGINIHNVYPVHYSGGRDGFNHRHVKIFFYTDDWTGDHVPVDENEDDAPASWVKLADFQKRIIFSHKEAFKMLISEARKVSSEFNDAYMRYSVWNISF